MAWLQCCPAFLGSPQRKHGKVFIPAAGAVFGVAFVIICTYFIVQVTRPQQHAAVVSLSETPSQAEAVHIDAIKGSMANMRIDKMKAAVPTDKQQCQGFQQPERELLDPPHPASSKRPNIIYLLIDDMGYDDLSLHRPVGGMSGLQPLTPNMNRLVVSGMEFTNFYTTPMCSTSRAELLTGRHYPRTGSFYINSGWDYMNINETNMGEIFSAAGYKTAHFGKWHNGDTAGYTPSDVGFQDSFMPTPYVHFNNTIYINRQPVETTGWMEDDLMSYALSYLKQREADGQPFLVYYPTFSVHAGWMSMDHAGPRYQRPAPPQYVDKFLAQGLSQDTAHLYGMLEHIDDQIGRLLSWLDRSGLAGHTYVFLGGDNGPALFSQEQRPVPKEVRMPSGMQGSKHEVKEGGIRNFLAVRGPGIPQGAVNRQLLGLVDVVPTLVELAGIEDVVQHLPWDGLSFVNLLRSQPPTDKQAERLIITMQTQCIEDDFIPLLGRDRHVLKPQPLLDYTKGGVSGLGFKRCIGVRYKQYKWLADASETRGQGPAYQVASSTVPTGLYRFRNNSHVELKCHEVSLQEADTASEMEAAATAWFASMLQSKHSFERPTFFLGLGGQPAANIEGGAAMERTPGTVQVLPMGVAGFVQPGDFAAYRIKVATAGVYDVSLSHQTRHKANLKLWVGPYEKIRSGTAMHLDVTLHPASQRTSLQLGSLELPQTPPGQFWEVKLQMTSNSMPGRPAVTAVDVIVFTLKGASGSSIAYNPDLQEGVKDWKVHNGYSGRRAA